MRKIIILIITLLILVGGVTWFYFKSISLTNNSSAKILNLIPDDAALVFEYKNEKSFYQIFENFKLFNAVLGSNCFNRLRNLETIFINNPQISNSLNKSDFYFSLHNTTSNHANFLVFAPLSPIFLKNNSNIDFINLLQKNYTVKNKIFGKETVFNILLKNTPFYFIIYQNIIIGCYDAILLQQSINYINTNSKSKNVALIAQNQRNKNSIANLYINFAKLPYFLNNFSRYKKSEITENLKNFRAYASLNINYQSNAFMFSGITVPDTTQQQYMNLFLKQEPGLLGLTQVLTLDAASYCAYYVSDFQKFNSNLKQLLKHQNLYQNLKKQVDNISKKHAINIEKEFLNVLGNDFGIIQLASGDKVGLMNTKNNERLSFILSTISTQTQGDISRFDDSNLLFYFFGEPLKTFKRPYFTVVNNYLAVCNSQTALKNFVKNYNQQKLLSLSSKYLFFQQYLSNKGNIFYFYHNKNAKGVVKNFLSNAAHKAFMSKAFNFQNIYGFSIQFSADKNKFYTNLYMNMQQSKPQNNLLSDSLYLDSLTQQNIN